MRSPRDTTPRLMKAKYPGTCSCKALIKPGDEILYYPASRKAECRDCATPTLEALHDEDMARRGY